MKKEIKETCKEFVEDHEFSKTEDGVRKPTLSAREIVDMPIYRKVEDGDNYIVVTSTTHIGELFKIVDYEENGHKQFKFMWIQ